MSNEWINTYDGVFFITISTLLFGCFGLVIKYCLRSKCDNINLCFGLITVHRNVELETQVIGRAQRIGRQGQLEVFFLYAENE
jgi:hypothetical protein